MADTDGAFQLLEGYLRQLDVARAEMVIFCADGARKYWRRFTALARRLELNAHLEIIDYTHAKQNLNEIVAKGFVIGGISCSQTWQHSTGAGYRNATIGECTHRQCGLK